ncbi:hypothetical protein [Mesorhizobium sp. CO1-1-7]|uniref:hypothetical protein n=1 Tax=Mesorhizobium sp. CO1-1-7 TaxID=2876632 RepID=UPI00398CCBB3
MRLAALSLTGCAGCFPPSFESEEVGRRTVRHHLAFEAKNVFFQDAPRRRHRPCDQSDNPLGMQVEGKSQVAPFQSCRRLTSY